MRPRNSKTTEEQRSGRIVNRPFTGRRAIIIICADARGVP